MSFKDNMKKMLIPTGMDFKITILILVILIISYKIGANNVAKASSLIIPIGFTPYFYKELMENNLERKKAIKYSLIFFISIFLFLLELSLLGLPKLPFLPYGLNQALFWIVFIAVITISFYKNKYFSKRTTLYIGSILIFLSYILPFFNLIK